MISGENITSSDFNLLYLHDSDFQLNYADNFQDF